MKRTLPLLPGLLAALLLSAGGPALAAAPPETGIDFGPYELVPVLESEPAYAGAGTPSSLDGVLISDQVTALLGPAEKGTLERQGFVIVPADFQLFHQAYEEQDYAGTPVFVTTDAAYHTWHLIFDKVLRDLEQQKLLPSLERLIAGMLENAKAQRAELKDPALASAAKGVVDLLQVAGAELGSRVGKLSTRAAAEKALIDAHRDQVDSPILGTFTDYSLYTPRGHYTRSEALTRYFKAMSVLGQAAFLLPGSIQSDESVVESPEALRLAVLATRTLAGQPELEALWKEIFEPTAFLVGVSDDYSPFELAAAVEATRPGGMADPLSVADDASLTAVADALKSTRAVEIDPERPSVRLMGTRFVIDSWVLDQMVYPNVGGEPVPERRFLASPLDLAAAFGSDFALAIQDEAGETAYLHYPEQMAAMRAALAARPDEAWGRTVYDAWLAAVEPMWLPHGGAFPDFMRSEAWKAKAQQTGFGSYAELKHDTILYTKQFLGEAGGTSEPLPASLRNWVEPDPVAFARLAAMAELMRDGLDARGLLTRAAEKLLRQYITMVRRLERLATDELAARAMSERDNEWLRGMGGILEGFWWTTGDKLRSRAPVIDEWAAIVADIGGGAGMVVEVATGHIDRIFVLVPNDLGQFQVASGGVYSYYEFLQPASDRLTDEAWRRALERGEAPERPAWEDPLFPS